MLQGLSGIVFPGGKCVSPMLFQNPDTEGCPEHDYDPARDVSDFLLMRYALAHDHHMLCI
ncbi:MAG: gamma-glutamyl-gamma-aminobutyrate hydrolase family protein [Candidatus Ornithospirochaeta sp.]|nr:gamma-glutamyl-gamma-aminobutyrate hydrolase family protein [Candidatus Ornithospirochaeta sp.]